MTSTAHLIRAAHVSVTSQIKLTLNQKKNGKSLYHSVSGGALGILKHLYLTHLIIYICIEGSIFWCFLFQPLIYSALQ